MRSTIRNILALFTLITIIAKSRGNSELRRGRLSRAYENIKRGINDDNIDLDCVKNFFNLPQNNDLMIYDVEEILFDFAADLKCSDGNDTFNSIYEKYIHDGWKEQLTCMKWHLQQLEETSKLVENFVINDSELRACKEFPILMELEGFVKRYEEISGPLNVYTCGAVSENAEADFLKFLTKGAVISYGDISEELKKTEMAKLKEYIKDTAVKTASCIMKRYQDDPQAFLINDTLNYYFKEQSIPTDLNKENVNNFMKRLTKFEESIDNNCAKEKLNLPKYGNKPLLEVEAKIVIASAKSKCIKVDPVEFSELFLDYAIEDGHRANRHFSCVRYKLHNVEPTSKLARNYVKDEKNDKFCSRYEFSVHVYSTLFYPYDDYVGKLSTTTCGVLTDEIYDLITLKTTLLFDEKDKDVRVSEAKNLFNFLIDKLQRLADCILERTK